MKKNLGQNFLVDKNIAELEVKQANIKSNDIILEIGPGLGILTKLLAEKAKKVIAIEIDEKLINNLKEILPENVYLIHEDALNIDFEELPKFNKIVSNLPFQISSPITFKILDYDFELAVLIYQKEFAERLVANPGNKNYSRLSVGVYYKSRCNMIRTISKYCFRPQPKVDSSMIKIIPREYPPFLVINEKFFFNLTKNLFNYRRKKIKSILNNLYNLDLKNVPYLENRVEDLSPIQIGELSDIIFEMLK
jgi:16S rRNA (adenine1518-N6/adenine1519-N6)-dimethyltransferase